MMLPSWPDLEGVPNLCLRSRNLDSFSVSFQFHPLTQVEMLARICCPLGSETTIDLHTADPDAVLILPSELAQ
jgi:hypothetical protein